MSAHKMKMESFLTRRPGAFNNPVIETTQHVIFQQPVEFLMRWRETRRISRVQTHTPLLRPSALLRAGGRP